MPADLIGVRDAARRLGVSYPTLKQWIYKGTLRTVQTAGGHHRVAESEIERFLARRGTGSNKRGSSAPRRRSGPPAVLVALSGRNQLRGIVEEVRTDGLMAQILAASLTTVQGVDLNVVGIVGEGQRATGMIGLSAGFAARLGSQALGLGPLTSISGWGTGTIAAILRGAVLQVAQPALELEGVIDQAIQVAFAPMPEILTVLIERVVGAHRHSRDRGKCL